MAKRNRDARQAIALARQGSCSRAGRFLDRARDSSVHGNRADEARAAGLIVRQLCRGNKEVMKATIGLRGGPSKKQRG
jgi:hypothetical protein